jgi:hypothetical protein
VRGHEGAGPRWLTAAVTAVTAETSPGSITEATTTKHEAESVNFASDEGKDRVVRAFPPSEANLSHCAEFTRYFDLADHTKKL